MILIADNPTSMRPIISRVDKSRKKGLTSLLTLKRPKFYMSQTRISEISTLSSMTKLPLKMSMISNIKAQLSRMMALAQKISKLALELQKVEWCS